jgi:peptide/nickel transport system ATP-binding protein
VVEYLAHEVAVMYLGRIVERGPAGAVLRSPRHPYTEALLSAVPSPRLTDRRAIVRLPGETPSPARPPSGCHFHPRCPRATEHCRAEYPEAREVGPGHVVSCFL